jgi:MFS transporter, FHS family, L-fucose permease
MIGNLAGNKTQENGIVVRRHYLVLLVLLTFFVISLLTNVFGPIVPDIISSFHVNLTAAGLLAFAFFIAYGVMSIPAGFLVERFSEKPVMTLAFVVATLGSLSFALFPRYGVAAVSLFAIGAGMATLQVAINPLLRVAGGEQHYAFFSALAQLVFSSASFLSPRLYSYLVVNLKGAMRDATPLLRALARVTPLDLPWVSIYWIFTATAGVMVLILLLSPFPRIQHTEQERPGSLQMYKCLVGQRVVWLYFVAMFAYVGCEQGTADWISSFLSTYHRLDPQTTGATAVSWFWGLLTAGCLIGLVLLKMFDSRRVLVVAASGALLCLSIALFGPSRISLIAFPAIGLFTSVLWPIVMSLALNSVSEYHGSFSGILGTAVIGGAIVPVIIGRIGDYAGLRAGMSFLYLTFAMVLSVGFWAKPLINNATLRLRQQRPEPVA